MILKKWYLSQIWTHPQFIAHSASLLLTLLWKTTTQVWILSHIFSFSLITQVNLEMERTESQLILKLSLDAVTVRLGILANLWSQNISSHFFCLCTNGRKRNNSSIFHISYFLPNKWFNKCTQVVYVKCIASCFQGNKTNQKLEDL